MIEAAGEHLDCPTCGAPVFARSVPDWRHGVTEQCECGEHLVVSGRGEMATAEVDEPAGDLWRDEAVRLSLPMRRKEW